MVIDRRGVDRVRLRSIIVRSMDELPERRALRRKSITVPNSRNATFLKPPIPNFRGRAQSVELAPEGPEQSCRGLPAAAVGQGAPPSRRPREGGPCLLAGGS